MREATHADLSASLTIDDPINNWRAELLHGLYRRWFTVSVSRRDLIGCCLEPLAVDPTYVGVLPSREYKVWPY